MQGERPKQDEDEARRSGSMHRRDIRASERMAVVITTMNTVDKDMKTNLCCMWGDAGGMRGEGQRGEWRQRDKDAR